MIIVEITSYIGIKTLPFLVQYSIIAQSRIDYGSINITGTDQNQNI